MPQVDEIIVSRHAAQEMMHCALSMAPQPCLGLLAGHGCNIDRAFPLVPEPETADASWKPHVADMQNATERIRSQGMNIIGWFHSRIDSHEPDEDSMQQLEQLSGSIPELEPNASPLHLLIALDTKGRLELHAYGRNHANRLESVPLHLLDDTPLYLRSARR